MRFEIRLLCIILFVRGYYGRIIYVIIEIKKNRKTGRTKIEAWLFTVLSSRRSSSWFYDGQYFEF